MPSSPKSLAFGQRASDGCGNLAVGAGGMAAIAGDPDPSPLTLVIRAAVE